MSELAGGLRFNTKFAALVIVLFPALMGLAGWQMWRSQEKAVMLAVVRARATRRFMAFPVMNDMSVAQRGEFILNFSAV